MTQSIIIGTTIGGEVLPPLVDFGIDPFKILAWNRPRLYIPTKSGRIRIKRYQSLVLNYGEESGVVVLSENRSYHLPASWLAINAPELFRFWSEGYRHG